jgi:nitrite reductase/ring-hydroxylating ferredoxin subunit
MGFPELRTKDALRADGARLMSIEDLPLSGVAEVETEHHGTLAVGLADGAPFATSNVCRHQLAKLGQGQVRDGCLECPWHRARYDVRTGKMTSGPRGLIFGFPPYSKGVKNFANIAWQIRVFPVTLRDGAIWLVE